MLSSVLLSLLLVAIVVIVYFVCGCVCVCVLVCCLCCRLCCCCVYLLTILCAVECTVSVFRALSATMTPRTNVVRDTLCAGTPVHDVLCSHDRLLPRACRPQNITLFYWTLSFHLSHPSIPLSHTHTCSFMVDAFTSTSTPSLSVSHCSSVCVWLVGWLVGWLSVLNNGRVLTRRPSVCASHRRPRSSVW